MTPGLLLRQALRESRGGLGRLTFSIICLAIGVAAVVAIAALSSSFESGIRANAKEMLGGDLSVRSDQKLPDGWDASLKETPNAEWLVAREQPQVVQSGAEPSVRSLLTELLVAPKGYPYYGDLALTGGGNLDDYLAADTAVLVPDAATRLAVKVGDSIRVGEQSLRVAAIAHNEPDRLTGFLYIGPRVYLSPEAFEKAGISDILTGVRYRALVKLPNATPEQLESAKAAVEEGMQGGRARVETYLDGRPSLQRGLDGLTRFLGLIALLSLLLGGVGVAQAVRAWIAGRMDSIAVLKCVGMRPREIFALYTAQAVFLGLIGSGLGALGGLAVTALVPYLFREYVPAHLFSAWQPRAALMGIGLGVAVSMVFSLPPLITVLRVPPIRVLRRNAEPIPGARWARVATTLVVGMGIVGVSALQARSAVVGTIFTGGVIVTGLVLAFAAWVLVKIVGRIPRDWGRRVWLRHGLASIARPGANTIPSIVSLGLGLQVLFSAGVVQNFVNQQLTGTLPERLPSAFVLNARPEQTDGLVKLLEAEGADAIEVTPLVMTKLTAVDGVQSIVAPDAPRGERDREELDRRDDTPEARRGRAARFDRPMTYLEKLPAANTLAEGTWWTDDDVAEASVEKEWADRLDLKLGSKLTFTLPGRTVDLVVTSLRQVDWKEMGLNFVVIAEPGTLDDAPQFRLATLHLAPGRASDVQTVVTKTYPNMTLVPVSDVVERIASQLRRIGWGVRMLGLFIVGAALAVLAGTIGIESSRRGREVALLKTIGMTRIEVVGVFAAEYALIGLIAGLIGVTGGGVVAWLTVVRALDAPFQWPFGMFALAIMSGMAVTVLAGIAASTGALRKRPIEMLRIQE